MPLPRKVAKNVYDAFTGDNSWQKNVYKLDPQDANSYIIDAEPDAGLQEALNGKQHEKDRADKAERERDTHKTAAETEKARADALDAEKRAGWKKDPDRDAIENDLRSKLTKAEDDAKAAKEASDKKFSDYIIATEADKIAEEISTYPTGMSREIRERLTVDLTGDNPIVRIKDKDGKATAMSVADLKKEFVDSPAHKAVIKASSASGGGAGQNGNGGGGSATKSFKDMSEVERTALFRSNRAEFDRLNAEHQAASVGY